MSKHPLLAGLAAVVLSSGCAGGDSSSDTTAVPGSTTPGPGTSVATEMTTSTALSTTVPATVPSTDAPSTTGATLPPPPSTAAPTVPPTPVPTAPATSVACQPFGSVDEKIDDFPNRMSSLIGNDVRTGAHPCFERLVIELQSSGFEGPDSFPGWLVRYADQPVTVGESDETLELRGSETLLITLNSWSYEYSLGSGYEGPRQIFPTNVSHLLELYLVDDWEGQHMWAVGLDARRPFTVTVLDGPPRLVVDVSI